MRTLLKSKAGPYLRRGVSTASIVILSVVTTIMVQRIVTPAPAAALPLQEQARDTTFVVPGGADMLARLGPGPVGNGNLRLWDTSGNLRVEIAGDGTMKIMDTSGNVVWQAP